MTPEKRYQIVCEMLNNFDAMTGNTAAPAVISKPWDFEKSLFPFYANAAGLLIECLTEMDKKKSGIGIAAVKRVLKKDDSRFSGIFTPIGSDWFIVCDGYRLYRLKEDLPSLPHNQNSAFTKDSIERIITKQGKPYALPTVAELKAHIAQGKAKGIDPSRYPIEVGDKWYNPQYLLDLLQAFPDVTLYDTNYFESEYADGILLNVHR